MSWTTNEEARIASLEVVLNDIQVAMKALAEKATTYQMLEAKQDEVDALTERIAALESVITILTAHLEL
jgi:uncharacterized coiled-coil protein SlyX